MKRARTDLPVAFEAETKAERDENKLSVTQVPQRVVDRLLHNSQWQITYRLPTQLLGQTFSYLNVFETVRFLHAMGHAGQKSLRLAFKSQLVVNMGRHEKHLLAPRDTKEANQIVRLQASFGAIHVLRLFDVSLPFNLLNWMEMVHSPELESVILHNVLAFPGHLNVFPDDYSVYLRRLQDKRKLKILKWSSPTHHFPVGDLNDIVTTSPLVEVLEIENPHSGVWTVRHPLPNVTLLQQLRVLSLSIQWTGELIEQLGQHCPLLEHVHMVGWEYPISSGVVLWNGLVDLTLSAEQCWHGKSLSAAIRNLFRHCRNLVLLSLSETEQHQHPNVMRRVLWKWDAQRQVWSLDSLSTPSYTGMVQHHDAEVVSLITECSPSPLAVDFCCVERPRFFLNNILTWAAQHQTDFQLEALEAFDIDPDHPEGLVNRWAEDVKPWLSLEMIQTIRQLSTPMPQVDEKRIVAPPPHRPFHHLFLSRGDWSDMAKAAHSLELSITHSKRGVHFWKVMARGSHNATVNNVLFGLKGSIHELIIEQDGNGSTAPVYEPELLEQYQATNSLSEVMLETVVLGSFPIVTYGNSAKPDAIWPRKKTPAFDHVAWSKLARLEINSKIIAYTPGLLDVWALRLPNLRHLCVSMIFDIDDQDWLHLRNLETLRILQPRWDLIQSEQAQEAKEEKKAVNLLSAETLDTLGRQNPDLEIWTLILGRTNVSRLPSVHMHRLKYCLLTLSVPSITTNELKQFQKQCPRLEQVYLRMQSDMELYKAPVEHEIAVTKQMYSIPGSVRTPQEVVNYLIKITSKVKLVKWFVRAQQDYATTFPSKSVMDPRSLAHWPMRVVLSPPWDEIKALSIPSASGTRIDSFPQSVYHSSVVIQSYKSNPKANTTSTSTAQLVRLGRQLHEWSVAHPFTYNERKRMKRWTHEIVNHELALDKIESIHRMRDQTRLLPQHACVLHFSDTSVNRHRKIKTVMNRLQARQSVQLILAPSLVASRVCIQQINIEFEKTQVLVQIFLTLFGSLLWTGKRREFLFSLFHRWIQKTLLAPLNMHVDVSIVANA